MVCIPGGSYSGVHTRRIIQWCAYQEDHTVVCIPGGSYSGVHTRRIIQWCAYQEDHTVVYIPGGSLSPELPVSSKRHGLFSGLASCS